MTRLTMWCQRLAQRIRLTGTVAAVFLVAPLVAKIVGLTVGDGVLWGTGVVILLYTYETYQMRRELVRQNEIAIQPLVLATVETRQLTLNTYGRQVVLRNIGRGPALHVHVDDFQHIPDGEGEWLLRIPPADCIEPGGEAVRGVIQVARRKGEEVYRGADRDRGFVGVLDPDSANKTYEIIVRYEDIAHRKYWAKVQMGKGGIRLLDHGQERRA